MALSFPLPITGSVSQGHDWSMQPARDLSERSIALSGNESNSNPAERIEQRPRLRNEQPLATATFLVRGGPDNVEKLRRHAERTARAWALDGQPLFGISVFATLGIPLDDLLRRRFTSFRTIYLPTAGRIAEFQFKLLPTGHQPHFTIQLQRADNAELDRLLAAFGAARPNSQYARGMIWREEG
jgi:hypothetical protein